MWVCGRVLRVGALGLELRTNVLGSAVRGHDHVKVSHMAQRVVVQVRWVIVRLVVVIHFGDLRLLAFTLRAGHINLLVDWQRFFVLLKLEGCCLGVLKFRLLLFGLSVVVLVVYVDAWNAIVCLYRRCHALYVHVLESDVFTLGL